jgi:hypothetical protein
MDVSDLREMRAASKDNTKKWLDEQILICKRYEETLMSNSDNARKYAKIKQSIDDDFASYRIPERYVKPEIYRRMSKAEKAAHAAETLRQKSAHFGGTPEELLRMRCLNQPDGKVICDPATIRNPVAPAYYFVIMDYIRVCNDIIDKGYATLTRHNFGRTGMKCGSFAEAGELVELLANL